MIKLRSQLRYQSLSPVYAGLNCFLCLSSVNVSTGLTYRSLILLQVTLKTAGPEPEAEKQASVEEELTKKEALERWVQLSLGWDPLRARMSHILTETSPRCPSWPSPMFYPPCGLSIL